MTTYNAQEAHRRFEGLLKLWVEFHKRCKNIETQEQLDAIEKEVVVLVDSYNEEMANYSALLSNEAPYMPTVEMAWDIQGHAICTGMHIGEAKSRFGDVKLGKAAFYDMLGQAPKKKAVWN